MAKIRGHEPDPVDIIVGANIRMHRNRLGVSQQVLAEALEMSFQQIQKYEKGTNRVASSNLVKIATRLGIDLPTLFEGTMPEGTGGPLSPAVYRLSAKGAKVGRGYDRSSPSIKKALLGLVSTVSGEDITEEADEEDVAPARKSA